MPINTVLVTGAAGFIGSHCTLTLLEAGYKVVAFDNFVNSATGSKHQVLPPSLQRAQQLTGQNVKFQRADMCNKEDLKKLFTEVMREFQVKHIIFSSSSTIYGDAQQLPITEDTPIGQCKSPYARTKYFQEMILKDVCYAEKDFNTICLRYFNPIGAHPSGLIGENPPGVPRSLTPYICQVAVGKLPHVNVFGNDYDTRDGTAIRDYTHVMDVAMGHVDAVKLLEREGTVGYKVFNLGAGRGYSVLEVIAAFEKACGHKIPYKIVARRPGDAVMVYNDSAKLAAKELDWKPKYNIDDACAHMLVFS